MLNQFKKGISLIEIVMVLAVLVLILAVVLPQFSKMRENQTMKSAVQEVLSAIDKARSLSTSSLDSLSYGVHFEENSVVIFSGTVYNASSTDNEYISIQTPAEISDISLDDSATEFYFDRISGKPNKKGSITISTNSFSKTITISPMGAISVE